MARTHESKGWSALHSSVESESVVRLSDKNEIHVIHHHDISRHYAACQICSHPPCYDAFPGQRQWQEAVILVWASAKLLLVSEATSPSKHESFESYQVGVILCTAHDVFLDDYTQSGNMAESCCIGGPRAKCILDICPILPCISITTMIGLCPRSTCSTSACVSSRISDAAWASWTGRSQMLLRRLWITRGPRNLYSTLQTD